MTNNNLSSDYSCFVIYELVENYQKSISHTGRNLNQCVKVI